jgi:hypothetical protein
MPFISKKSEVSRTVHSPSPRKTLLLAIVHATLQE